MNRQQGATGPNFIVAGAIKAGTSTLHHFLKQHPQIFVPDRKELRYFAYDPKDQWCLDNPLAFPIKSFENYLEEFSSVESQIAVGEVSPNYLASNFAPDALHSRFPHMKLIFSLRNPVDSAYSAYQMDTRAGRERRPMEAALATSERRVKRYRYYNYLKQWYALFGREQILVICFDDLISQPEFTMAQIYAFLGVDPSYTLETNDVATNQGGLPETFMAAQVYRATIVMRRFELIRKARSYVPNFFYTFYRHLRDSSLKKAPPMPDSLRQNLGDYYREDVQALQDLTQTKFETWGIL